MILANANRRLQYFSNWLNLVIINCVILLGVFLYSLTGLGKHGTQCTVCLWWGYNLFDQHEGHLCPLVVTSQMRVCGYFVSENEEWSGSGTSHTGAPRRRERRVGSDMVFVMLLTWVCWSITKDDLWDVMLVEIAVYGLACGVVGLWCSGDHKFDAPWTLDFNVGPRELCIF